LPEATKLPIESISWLYGDDSGDEKQRARWITMKDTGCLRVLRLAVCRDDDDDAQSDCSATEVVTSVHQGSRDKGTCIGYSDEYS